MRSNCFVFSEIFCNPAKPIFYEFIQFNCIIFIAKKFRIGA